MVEAWADQWKPVSANFGLRCADPDCPETVKETGYVHRNRNDKVFCSALCCVAFYFLAPVRNIHVDD